MTATYTRTRRLLICFLALLLTVATVVATPTTAHAQDVTTNPGPSGWNPTIVLGSDGNPIIAFRDGTTALSILQCGDASCSSGNRTVSLNGAYGSPSMALDSLGRPVVVTTDLVTLELVVFRCVDAVCSALSELVRPDPDNNEAQARPSIALDAEDRPIIASWNNDTVQIQMIHCGDPLCQTNNSATTPDLISRPLFGSGVVLSSAGLPVVAYPDFATGQMQVLRCGNLACTADNSVTRLGTPSNYIDAASLALTADDEAIVAVDLAFDGIKLRTCGDRGCYNRAIDDARSSAGTWALALDESDNPVVVVYDESDRLLKVVRCLDTFCDDRRIETLGTGADEGRGAAIALTADGFPVIAFHNITQDLLEVVACDDLYCSPEPVAPIDLPADANCDGAINILDAVATAQYVVGTREGSATCADITEAGQMSVAAVSIDDRPVTVLNAFWVAECVVGLNGTLCPEQGPIQQ